MKKNAVLSLLIVSLMAASQVHAMDLGKLKSTVQGVDTKLLTLGGTIGAGGEVNQAAARAFGVTALTRLLVNRWNHFAPNYQLEEKWEAGVALVANLGHAYLTDDANLAVRLLTGAATWVGFDWARNKLTADGSTSGGACKYDPSKVTNLETVVGDHASRIGTLEGAVFPPR